MKTGLTIQQMAQELLRQSKAKQDYLVNTGSLSLSVTSDAPQLRVTENGLDNWIYALNFGKETVQVIDTSEWMGRSYELIAVLYTHKPTGFQFTNYCIRPAGIISSSSRHDLLLYDWAEHQAGADSY